MTGLLVCCGSLTLDNVITAEGRRLPQAWGGNVIYSALGARIWHDRVGLVSRAGTTFPQACLDRLAAAGLDTAGITRVDAPHGMNVAFCYAADGSRVRAFPPEVVAGIPPAERARFVDYTTGGPAVRYAVWSAFAPEAADIPAAWLTGLAGLHCAAMPVEHHLSLAAAVRRQRGPTPWVQVDSPWYDERDLGRDHASALLPLLDALLPSEDDLARWRPGMPAQDALAAIAAAGARRIVLKRGGLGCTVLGAGGGFGLPVVPDAEVVDLTGAGDAFCGGFLAGMHTTGDLREAALRATVSASFAIEQPGFAGLLEARRDAALSRLESLRRIAGPRAGAPATGGP